MLPAENRDDGYDSFFYDDLFMAANKSSQIENLAETQSLVHKETRLRHIPTKSATNCPHHEVSALGFMLYNELKGLALGHQKKFSGEASGPAR